MTEHLPPCEPPPDLLNLRWHWLRQTGFGGKCEPVPASLEIHRGHMNWRLAVMGDSGSPDWMAARGWQYLGPCIPPEIAREPKP